MKNMLLTGSLLLLSTAGIAAEGFSCEKIKEKSVRASCIAARDEAAQQKKADVAAEEARLAAASSHAETEAFVSKSKALLTRNFKDPQSAQYQELALAETKIDRTLCGAVNAKNSYGGFVGFKRFYVSWWSDPRVTLAPRVWIEGESTKNLPPSASPAIRKAAMDLEALERDQATARCGASDTTTVTPVM